MLADATVAFVTTLRARWRRGPLRPSWSFLFELAITLLRATVRASAGRPMLEQRAVWDALKPLPSAALRRVRRERIEAGGVPAEWFTPKAGHGERVVLYLHGGGFVFGSSATHAELITRLALAAEARVLAVEYRLTPEAVFPAALDDVVAAYRWLLSEGVRPDQLVIAGDSAGGNLTLTGLLRLRERGAPLPAGAIPICPWVDPLREGGSLIDNERFDWAPDAADARRWCAAYAGDAEPSDPLITPLRADLRGLPPLLILWGECEVLRDQVREFAEAARAAGVDVTAREYPDMVHDWMTLYAFTPEAEAAFQAMGEFARRVTEPREPARSPSTR